MCTITITGNEVRGGGGYVPRMAIELETGIAISQATAILMPTIRFVARCLEPNGFFMPK